MDHLQGWPGHPEERHLVRKCSVASDSNCQAGSIADLQSPEGRSTKLDNKKVVELMTAASLL